MVIEPKMLHPGDLVWYEGTPGVHILDRRKEDDSGWWLRDRGGIADHAWAHGTWTVAGNDYLQMAYNAICSAEASIEKAGGHPITGRLVALRAELGAAAFPPGQGGDGDHAE